MNAERLLTQYEQVADAPDAIDRLRQFILDLGVRGKLLPQDPIDEPASELLKRLHRERTHKRKFAQIDEDELETPLPDLPAKWLWTTADQISADDDNSITDGPFGSQLKTEHYIQKPGFRVIRLQNIGGGTFRAEHHSYIDQSRYEHLSKHHIRAGDLVVAGLVDPGVRCCEVPDDIGPALVKADCYRFAVHPKLSSRYALHFLNSTLAQDFAAVHHHGMTLTRIGLGNFRRIPVPLPPLAEQHRIVTKVDELMVLCDRLEAARENSEAARDRLAVASLARLNAPDPETFQADARFALDALPALTTRPDQIKQLRRTILNLAVRGKLVPQDANDEPASQLIKRIGKAIPSAEIGEGTAELQPFDLPPSWVWTRLGRIVSHSEAGWSPRTEDHPRNADEWGVLKVSAVSWDEFRPSENKQILPGTEPRLQAEVKRGDFLISRANTAELVARAVIVKEDPIKLMMSDKIVRLRLSEYCDHRFVWIVNNYANFSREYYIRHASGVSPSMKNVSRGAILNLPLPLPPLAEQHRIVAKADALMALCDRLEASLAATAATRRRLLDALLAEALTPAEDREMQAAE